MVGFVYQASNKPPRPGADPCEAPCKPIACALQQCIAKLPVSRSGAIDHTKCMHHMDKWNVCCDAIKGRSSSPAKTDQDQTSSAPQTDSVSR